MDQAWTKKQLAALCFLRWLYEQGYWGTGLDEPVPKYSPECSSYSEDYYDAHQDDRPQDEFPEGPLYGG